MLTPVVETIEENLRATLRMFATAKANGRQREYPGVAISCSGLYFAMFNSVLLTSAVRSASELRDRAAVAAQHFRMLGLPWSFWICDDRMSARVRAESRSILRAQGLQAVVELPAMAANRIRPPVRDLPGLEFRRVGDEETRFAFNHIMSATFGIPITISAEVYRSERMWKGNFVGYLGYVDGNAVSTAATVTAGGVVGLYAVATLPAHQRMGYAEVTVRHVLEQARHASGIETTVLQSSAAGFELYQRLGYKTVTHYTVYACT